MKNKLLGISLLTITCLYGLLAAIVILAVMLAGGDILYAIIGSIIVIIIQFLIAPWLTDFSMKFFYHADFNKEIPQYLKEFIEQQCAKHGVKYPKVGIIDDGGPNAFTYGRTKKDARIILTRGIFELLSEDEVKAVVGHEMGHIVHLDMLVMTVVQIVPLILYAVYEMCTRNIESKNNDENKLALVGYIAYVLYVISQYIILWLSRTREYYADEFSVEETQNPKGLAEALVKIGFGLSKRESTKTNVSKNNALGIFNSNSGKELAITSMDSNGNIDKNKIKNAMKWEMWNPWAKWFEFNSTHPLISKRLQAISKLSTKYNQEPYIVFDLEQPESYVDDFLIEVLISFLPAVAIIATLIVGILCFTGENLLPVVGAGLILTVFFSYIKFKRAHKTDYEDTNVENLLGEVKVSHITSVPCILKGTIIGRGNPGCIFNEDFVIKDQTGIIFLDYNQPLTIMNKIFALFKSQEYFDKEVKVKGWYRRSPVPYVEIYEYEVDGKTKKVYTYKFTLVLYVILLIVAAFLIMKGFM
jgi:heat shock protein HtpX